MAKSHSSHEVSKVKEEIERIQIAIAEVDSKLQHCKKETRVLQNQVLNPFSPLSSSKAQMRKRNPKLKIDPINCNTVKYCIKGEKKLDIARNSSILLPTTYNERKLKSSRQKRKIIVQTLPKSKTARDRIN